MSDRENRQEYESECSVCGEKERVPFKTSQPDVYCEECWLEHATPGVDRFGRKVWDTKCSNCAGDVTVPFEPDGVRPVYCKACQAARYDLWGDETHTR